MPRTEFASALSQVAAERGIEAADIIETIKEAIKAAYRKDYGAEIEELEVDIDPDSGEARIMREGKDVTPEGFGRIAAQTAKQVILQRIRESEKAAILSEYERKVGTVVNGMVQRIEGPVVHVDIGKAEGIMPPSEQVDGEIYRQNQRLKFYIKEIREGSRGSEIIVSRSAKELVQGLFKLEVPEINSGVVEIRAIAREAGKRTKVAVVSRQAGVDPVGSCVGQKGVRVQAVIAELGDEKIDIILYSEETAKFIASALSPAKIDNVMLNEEEKTATVYVAEDQLSLAIGKEGQNVRLAAKLTGYRIDIKGPQDALDALERAAAALAGEDIKETKPRAKRASKKTSATEPKAEPKPKKKAAKKTAAKTTVKKPAKKSTKSKE
ncbi:MAG TPA: transcription termination factor NusA [Patescibacteria group bacterium]|nr:transcription termination factor NusA [Patescibacteria group bacterium]